MADIDPVSATPAEVDEAVKSMDSAGFDRLMQDLESRERITRALVGYIAGLFRPRRLAMRRKLAVLGDLKLGARLPDLFAF